MTIHVLYEDRRDGSSPFGLHRLVVRCVCDKLLSDVWEVEASLRDIPKGGNGKVFDACRNDLGRLTRDGSHVIAVYDMDKAHNACRPPLTAPCCIRRLAEALSCGCVQASKLSVVLINRNLETLLSSIQRLDPSLVSVGWAQRLFNRSSHRPAAHALRPASWLAVNVPQVRFLLAPSRSGASLPCSVRPDRTASQARAAADVAVPPDAIRARC